MRQVLYIFTGLPYAGKTTLRNELVKRFNFSVISIDELNAKNNVGIDPNIPITHDDWDNVYREAYALLKMNLSEGKSIIFDGGSLLFQEREVLRQIAKELNAEVKLIYVNTPIEVAKKRWLKNQQTKARSHVPKDLFEQALAMWQEPTPGENPILFSNNDDVNEWIQKNF